MTGMMGGMMGGAELWLLCHRCGHYARETEPHHAVANCVAVLDDTIHRMESDLARVREERARLLSTAAT